MYYFVLCFDVDVDMMFDVEKKKMRGREGRQLAPKMNKDTIPI